MNAHAQRAGFECAQDLLKRGETVTLVALGGSMRPFIQDGDRLCLSVSQSPPCLGQIVWAIQDERDFIHRVIEVGPNGSFKTRGDALHRDDGWIKSEDYLGTVMSVERLGVTRSAPDSKPHLCLVAFFRGLRHINRTLAAALRRGS